MSKSIYRSLIDQLCALASIPNSKSFYDFTAIELNEVDFTLTYKDSTGAGDVLLYGDMGSLALRDPMAAALRLLEMNFYLFGGQSSPIFTLNPGSQRINLCVTLMLEQLTAGRLLELLGELADMTKAWRQDFFLGVNEFKRQPGHAAGVNALLHNPLQGNPVR
ncbi:CesT family type III secretion system chaperone [Pseudomonas sp. GL-B-16]|uniref:CesT family type III secretion system chaperone n=1 Tax=Pseudomonas sp. GL-B-16 TaxID=2832373 RepID=UPI001CC147D5|nr:CesT family type III secretion system chaperone [Pseudomonas sp. GL-B-16]